MTTRSQSLNGLAAVLGALALAVILMAFIVPAFAALAPILAKDSPGLADATPAGIATGRIFAALRFTLLEALLSALVATAIGFPAALLVARRDFPGRRFLLALSGVPLCVPPVIIALAFVLFYGRQGYLNSFLMSAFGLEEPPITFLYSLAGVVIAHGFYNFPVVLRTVSVVWERLNEAEEEAALLLGAGRIRVFRTITLPRLTGAILSSAVLVFLYCFFSFVIVLLFGGVGGTTLEVELYQAARSALDFRSAGQIALVETVAALGIVALYVRAVSLAGSETGGSGRIRSRSRLSGLGERVAAVGYLLFILIFFIGPLVSVFVRSFASPSGGTVPGGTSFSFAAWTTFFGRPNFLPAFINTVSVALASAALATSAALFFAFAQDRPALKSGRVVSFLGGIGPFLPLAVSSVMLGFGWSILVPRGNRAVLIFAEAAIAWPFAWAQIRTGLDRIPRSVFDAASLLSRNRLDVYFRVLIPLLRKSILSGAGFVFAISAGDATLPLVLSIRGFENLPLLLFRLSGSYRFSEACACAVFIAFATGFVFFAEDSAGRRADVSGERSSS